MLGSSWAGLGRSGSAMGMGTNSIPRRTDGPPGRPSGARRGGRAASTSPPAISRAGTWSTCWICPPEDVAIALGHTDGGELVRKLYGHCDQERALDRVTAAYGRTASLTQMRLV
jgi:hypothetical protein